jgi:hypothetical protein
VRETLFGAKSKKQRIDLGIGQAKLIVKSLKAKPAGFHDNGSGCGVPAGRDLSWGKGMNS